MTAGTFVSLCTNPQVFVQASTLERVCGTISGSSLTITSENSQSTTTVGWMVIAERIDPLIKKWERTNAHGYLVTEYIPTPSPYESA
jgi:hypothetical protein